LPFFSLGFPGPEKLPRQQERLLAKEASSTSGSAICRVYHLRLLLTL
jgi:hypothetical protein